MCMVPIYKRLRNYLVCNEFCQKTVALDAGMTQAKLSQLLTGHRRLTIEDYLRICRALKLDPRRLLTPDPMPGPRN